jgi:hypothetical protein
MMRIGMWIAVISLATIGCRHIQVAGECPESAELKCMTRKVCVEDKQRGCLVCQCEDPFQTDPSRKVEEIERPDMVP